jgi:hypothetical protein
VSVLELRSHQSKGRRHEASADQYSQCRGVLHGYQCQTYGGVEARRWIGRSVRFRLQDGEDALAEFVGAMQQVFEVLGHARGGLEAVPSLVGIRKARLPWGVVVADEFLNRQLSLPVSTM